MSRQYWGECIFWATASGTQITNSTTETVIYQNVTIPANTMQDGRSIRVRLTGSYNTTTSAPTIHFAVRWGGVAGSVLAQSYAITPAISTVNGGFDLNLVIQTRSNGATGTLLCSGTASVFAAGSPSVGSATNASADSFMGYPSGGTYNSTTTPTLVPGPATVDLTADTALAITAKFSAANASNNLTGLSYIVELLN